MRPNKITTNKNGAKLFFLFAALFSSPFAKIYQANPANSTLSYELIHPMHKVIGVSKDFTCTVDLSSDTLTSKIDVSASIGSFDSENSSRDSHAMEIVEALKYPKVEFKSSKVKPMKNGYQVEGELYFHGITKQITFFVRPVFSAKQVEIVGSFTIQLSVFNVPRPSLMFVPTEDKLTITFDLFSDL